MQSTRRTAAIACVALIVFAPFLPLLAMPAAWVILTPVFALFFVPATFALRREPELLAERTTAFLSLLDTRGPPQILSCS